MQIFAIKRCAKRNVKLVAAREADGTLLAIRSPWERVRDGEVKRRERLMKAFRFVEQAGVLS
jgi:hypothetical protein